MKTRIFGELTDEEMALPDSKSSKKQVESWLSKGDGKKYDIEEAFRIIKTKVQKSRKKKK